MSRTDIGATRTSGIERYFSSEEPSEEIGVVIKDLVRSYDTVEVIENLSETVIEFKNEPLWWRIHLTHTTKSNSHAPTPPSHSGKSLRYC
jgi:hypothetical protein